MLLSSKGVCKHTQEPDGIALTTQGIKVPLKCFQSDLDVSVVYCWTQYPGLVSRDIDIAPCCLSRPSCMVSHGVTWGQDYPGRLICQL